MEHRRKSLTIGTIVAAASFLFTLGFSVLDTAAAGIHKEYRDRVTGDLYITAGTPKPLTAFGWKDMGEMAAPVPRLPSLPEIRRFVGGLPGVESVTPRAIGIVQVTSDALVGDKDPGTAGIGFLMGVETADYATVFPDALRLVSGKPWDGDGKGVILSDLASKSLGRHLTAPGSRLTLSTPGISGTISEGVALGTLAPEEANPFMSLVSYVDIDSLRPLLGYYLEDGHSRSSAEGKTALQGEADLFSGDMVTAGTEGAIDIVGLVSRVGAERPVLKTDPDAWQYLVIMVKNGASASFVRRAAEAFIAREGIEAKVYDWLDGAGLVASTVFSMKTIFDLIAVIVGMVALLIIMNALVISVTERTAEIGTMRAIGGTRRFVKELIVTETLMLSGVSGLAGLLLGAGAVELLSATGLRATNFIFKILFGGDIFRPSLSLTGCAATIVAVLAIGFIASLYPTTVALRVAPSVAMQRD